MKLKCKKYSPPIIVLNEIQLEDTLVVNSAVILPVDGSGKVREEWITDEVTTDFEW